MTEDDPTGAYSKKGQAIAIGEDICKIMQGWGMML